MRKSISSPCLTSLQASNASVTPKKFGIGVGSMKKSTSVAAGLETFSIPASHLYTEFVHELQIESALHVPGFVAAQCDAFKRLPKDVLNPNHHVLLEEDIKDVVTCMATPVESDFGSLQQLRNMFNNQRLLQALDNDTLDKYMGILRSIRKQRKRIKEFDPDSSAGASNLGTGPL